jgi:hypothetical protein
MDHPSGLDSNPVQILALNVYVLSHHTLPRASFHLKTRQEYFFYENNRVVCWKPDLIKWFWFSTHFGTPFADFS